MNRQPSRFGNHLDEHLVRLHKNLLISQGDPQYYEKVIRYLDPQSPEAHFRIAQKHQLNGNLSKAIFHYKEVLRIYPSSYYSKANRAVKQLEARLAEDAAARNDVSRQESKESAMPFFLKSILIVLLLLNLVLILLYFFAAPVSKTITAALPWGVGKQITYETVDVPYQMFFPYTASKETIENELYKRAIELGKLNPEQNVLIYGIATNGSATDGKVTPLTNESYKTQAFVIAEYYSRIDPSVKIRFLNPDYQKMLPQTALAANLVRTALQSYMLDHGDSPAALGQLLCDYPANYLSFVPLEALTRSNDVHTQFDGLGGWVYDGSASAMDAMFYPNTAAGGSFPFEPFQLVIEKDRHSLMLLSGTNVLWDKRVGLGADDRTPTGEFTIADRVISPRGVKPNMYGSAGLGFGELAVHGTGDTRSIGANLSLGCIRMNDGDIQDLFPFVPKGTQVIIANEKVQLRDKIWIGADLHQIIPERRPSIDEAPEQITFHWLG